jgi:hypothetical protein
MAKPNVLEINEDYYVEIIDSGSASFPYSLTNDEVIEADDYVMLMVESDQEVPPRLPISAKITRISSAISVGTQKVCSISVEGVSAASMGGRLAKTLKGHHFELLAAFARSSTHKLPGSKGRLRENAVAKFLQAWIPRRFICPSNVFLTHETGDGFPNEIDLVVYDAMDGPLWPLDGEEENCVLAYRHVKAILEVKSTLDNDTLADAVKAMQAVTQYMSEVERDLPKGEQISRPITILFAYQVDEVFFQREFCQHLQEGPTPFDLIIVLGKAAYFSNERVDMAIAFARKITTEEAERDLEALKDTERHYVKQNGPQYLKVSSSSDDILMALAYTLASKCAGARLTAGLLSALSVKGNVTPVDAEESSPQKDSGSTTVHTASPPGNTDDSIDLFNELWGWCNLDSKDQT